MTNVQAYGANPYNYQCYYYPTQTTNVEYDPLYGTSNQAVEDKYAMTEMSEAEKQAAMIAAAKAQTQQATQKVQAAADAECADGKDDGSIGFWGATKNFFKGVGNFFKGMVCDENGNFSLKKTLTTVAVAAGAVALSFATGGAATPFLIAAGATMATCQVGKGVYKACTAKTDREAEAAWQDIGAGTTGVVLSVAGAKGALKSSGMPVPKGNCVTSSLRATGECFKIASKGAANAAKSMLHPIKTAKTIGSYWTNTAKPRLTEAFSWKTGHKNFTQARENKFNSNIKDIEAQIKTLNDELATNPSASRVAEINNKLSTLNSQKQLYEQGLSFNNNKAKAMQRIEEQIVEVERQLADSRVTIAERNFLNARRNKLYDMAAAFDTKYKQFINSGLKNQSNRIAELKNSLKTATGPEKAAIESELKALESLNKIYTSTSKIELAQHNVTVAKQHITRLNDQLRLATTDAQKASIQSRINTIQKATVADKNTLMLANAKIAAKQNYQPVMSYMSGNLANAPAATLNDATAQMYGFESLAQMEEVAAQNGVTAEQLADYLDAQYAAQGTTASQVAQAAQQAANEQAMLQAQQQANQQQVNQQALAQTTNYNPYAQQNPFGNMPYTPNLDFNSLYVSPYPPMA